jgi:hypothetical protein
MAAVASSVIAASVAIAAAGAGMAMSFDAAAKARKKEAQAMAEVKDKMSAARKKLETNYMDVLAINKEPFERQREALLSAGAQALEAGIESERGGAAVAGRLLAAQNEAQGQVRDAQSDRLFDLEAAQAEEDSRLRDIGVQLDLGEVAGAQDAAAASADKAAMMTNQGLQGVVNTAAAIGSAAPLYAKNASARQAAVINRQGGGQEAVNAKTMDLTDGYSERFKITEKTGYDVGDIKSPATAGIGVKNKAGYVPPTPEVLYTEPTSNFSPQQNRWDGVDITPIMNNPSKMEFETFLSKQDGKWARDFREALGIKTKAGQAIDFLNPFN